MKNLNRIFGIIILAAVIAFTLASCGEGAGGGGGSSGDATSASYSGIANGFTYTLTITGSRAAYQPKSGDTYILTAAKTSTGTVSSISNFVLTLTPAGTTEPFTVTISGNSITIMSGMITWSDNTTDEAPATLTPPASGGGSNTIFTYTGPVDTTITPSSNDFSYVNYQDNVTPTPTPLSTYLNSPASVKISGSNVTLNLGVPKTLTPFDDNELMNPKDAKGWGVGDIVTSDGKYKLVCMKDGNRAGASLFYLDRDLTVKGTIDGLGESASWKYIYNVSAKAGWNYHILSLDESAKTYTNTASTTLPSGFKWTVVDY
jgi:hypothetical protein